MNVDVDVPLFLPLYGQRRLHDLRRIAGREIKENFRIDGQMNFDSGWEWGYWLNDVVRAVFVCVCVCLSAERESESLSCLLSDTKYVVCAITRMNRSQHVPLGTHCYPLR